MARQRKLAIPESIRLARVWFSILGINPTTWGFWNINQNVLSQLCALYSVSDLIDWAPPYARIWGSLKIFLKAISSYLSKGNFEGELNAWLARPVIPAVPPDGEEPEPPGIACKQRETSWWVGHPTVSLPLWLL